ncbi:hypothetical protein DEFR109230_10770 [Deinococcus frigens]
MTCLETVTATRPGPLLTSWRVRASRNSYAVKPPTASPQSSATANCPAPETPVEPPGTPDSPKNVEKWIRARSVNHEAVAPAPGWFAVTS